jgi:hypothetical protein
VAHPWFLLFAALASLLGGLLWLGGRESAKLSRRIRATQPTSIERLKPGWAEVKGEVVAVGPARTSPLGNAACVYYHLRVEERLGFGRGEHWEKIVDEKRYGGCALDDGTGRVVVRIEDVEFHLDCASVFESGVGVDALPELEAVLHARGESSKGMLLNRTLRYEEEVLAVGAQAFAMGTVERIKGEYGHELVKAPKDVLLVSTKPEEEVADSMGNVGCFGGVAGIVLAIAAAVLTYKAF